MRFLALPEAVVFPKRLLIKTREINPHCWWLLGMSSHLRQTDTFLQVTEPKHFNIKSQGFMVVFDTKPVELKELCLKK